MKKLILIATLLAAVSAAAADLPPGKWWERPEVADRLGLSADQKSQLEAAFRSAANELIDRKAEVDKLALRLRDELDREKINRGELQKVAADLSNARGRLFQRELMMLADMREVLSEEQWTMLRSQLDRRRQQRPPQRRR